MNYKIARRRGTVLLSMSELIAVMDDLFFMVKVQDGAKRAGMNLRIVKTEEAAIAAEADLVVVDLNCKAIDPLRLIAALKGKRRVIGYLSHVQTELRQQALEAGYDAVYPRSAFSSKLADILKAHV